MAERSSLNQVVQMALESTPGTAVTTGFRQFQSIGVSPSVAVEVDQFRPAGQKYKGFTTLGKEWTTASISGRATYTELVYFLSSVIDTATITTPAGTTGARKWTFVSDPTADDVPKTFTVRHGSSVRAEEFSYGLVNEFGLNFTRSSVEVTGSMMGKNMDTATLASGGSLSASLSLVPVLPTQVSVFMDDTTAALGGTRLTRVTNAEWSLGSRFNPVYPLDSDNGTTFAAMIESEPDLTLNLTMEADSQGMIPLTALRAGTRKFIRIEAVGATFSAPDAAASYKLTLDTAVEVVDTGGFNDNDGLFTIDWSFVGVNDGTWAKPFQIEVTNLQTAL